MKINTHSASELATLDHQFVWHPFTQHKDWFDAEPLIVERGEGFELVDVEGRRYLDGVSSLWCNVHGHGDLELIRALHEQVERLCHSTLLGLSHVPAIELAERIVDITPSTLTKVFYSDSGSAAVEASIRMALEWWQKKDTAASRKRHLLVSLESAYHGDTLGSVGLGYVESFHSSLRNNIVPSLKVLPPHYYRFFEGLSSEAAEEKSISLLLQLFRERADSIAAFIIEPLVQGAAGIWEHSARYLQAVANACKQHNILLIVDEVATGFGKTGTLFACEQAEVQPDMLVMGKGLSAGYLPISAVVSSEEVFQGFMGEPEELRTFFFGQTFCGNPLAASVSMRNLELFEERSVLPSLAARIQTFADLLGEHIAPLAHVDEIRRVGVMCAIELTSQAGARQAYAPNSRILSKVVLAARRKGVIVRPLGNAMILMPAITMDTDNLTRLVRTTAESIREVTEA